MTIEEYTKARDEILLAGDIDQFIKLVPVGLGSYEVAEIAFHQARTAIPGLPLEIRQASKYWLTERGFNSLDNGDLA